MREYSQTREEATRTELCRVLESASFRGSRRCSEFLKYVVEHTISGARGALKERSIGVELFQLPPDFDTGQTAIVRVTANEVRKKLAQYYMAENGAPHTPRIGLPPGSYSAEFQWEATAVKPHGRQRPLWLIGALIAACVSTILGFAGVFSSWRWPGAKGSFPATNSAAAPSSVSSLDGGDLRIAVGSANLYMDRNGRTWDPDRFFSGGTVLVRPSERILRTLDPDIYRHTRRGDFRYDIPLARGFYELHLHFAETGLSDSISAESNGEGERLFRVSANGKTILDAFDVVADAAGQDIADERVFGDISPAEDGFLHLSFVSLKGTAILSGIEVLPAGSGKVRPVRIRAGWTRMWQDPAGEQWLADSYFWGGNALVRRVNPAQEKDSILPGMDLYGSERWGNFSYSIPVGERLYRATLKFCEGHYGPRNTGVGGLGSRIFDVYCNGVALLRNFDIFKAAGGEGKPVDRTFSRIRPTAQGKIVLTFVPVKGMACVNAIEVAPE